MAEDTWNGSSPAPQAQDPWAELENTNRLLASVADSTDVMMACLDRDFNFLWVNRAYAEAANREPESFLGKNHFDLYPHEENEAIFRHVIETGEPFSIQAKPFEHPDQPDRGTTYWDWSLVPVKGPDGDVERLLFTLMDVTESEKARRQLRDNEAQLSAVFESVPFVMMVVDPERRVQTINRAGTEFADRRSDDLEGLRGGEALQCIHALDNPERCGNTPHCDRCVVRRTILDTVQTGRSHQQVQADMAFRVDGQTTEKTFLVYTTPLELSGQERVLVVFEDVTERERARRKLKELAAELEQRVARRTAELKRRSAELEQLANELTRAEARERQRIADILHDDLQQTLAYAKLRASSLAASQEDDSEARTARDVINALSEAIETSRSLSRELNPPWLNTGGLSAALEHMAQNMSDKHGLKVTTDISDLGAKLPDEVSLFAYHSISELLFNVAKHAGTDHAHLNMNPDGDCVHLVVEDEGRGFDPESLRNTGGDDSGFGLFSIQQRAELVGGQLDIQSTPGEGSRFELTLPTGPTITA